ncbi:MAG: methyltransferase domain-containing protein [Thermodesulfobacteriota bacterium]|nr:methyltransferase domain-containing protein [Thermodesulfobacteriota bacterium]
MQTDPDWWKTIFDEVYLLTDARSVCNEDITRREVDLICQLLPIGSGDKILDLCGGHGRHSLEFCARGFTGCTLVDYSGYLIHCARTRAGECRYPIKCIQADARDTGLPSDTFDHVLIMGNSLGYIPEATADREILEEGKRVLRPGGWLLVDVTDGQAVRETFSPKAWHEINEDMVVCRDRKLEGNTLWAREIVVSKQKGLIRDRSYAIRLYEDRSIGALFKEAGFSQVKVHTNFCPHKQKGDYGFMNCRMFAAGQKP